jgi:poly(beta-D-mannuronate) lyase
MMRQIPSYLTLLTLLNLADAKDIPVADPSFLPAAQPGDTLILPDGEFKDLALLLIGKGTQEAPITLKATTPGKTVFTGKSTLKLAGEHLVINGLHFKEPDPTLSDLIMFRKDSKTLASHCRMTNCAITSTVPQDSKNESRWLGLYGEGHRVDHCTFTGKTGKGTTFVVWLGDGSNGRHQIDHNHFGPREKLGKNGGETIRLGDSKTSMLTGGCIVEHNLFEKCNGEAECISNKSCGNIYRENTFLEVSGTLTLRHGNGCTVERNVFIGNEASGTGGVRVIGEDHVVRRNYFENLTGDDARSAICLMMGIPNSPANRYFQVKRAKIIGNTLVNCEHPILIGLEDDPDATLAPEDTTFEGNVVSSPKHAVVEARCNLSGISWKGNFFRGKELGIEFSVPMKIPALKAITRAEVGTQW